MKQHIFGEGGSNACILEILLFMGDIIIKFEIFVFFDIFDIFVFFEMF